MHQRLAATAEIGAHATPPLLVAIAGSWLHRGHSREAGSDDPLGSAIFLSAAFILPEIC
jgi:hypothetical protein